MIGDLSKFKVKIKRGRAATSVGILKGTCIFEWGVGQRPICKCLRRAGSPRGHTRQAKLQDSKASSIFSGKFKRVLLS
jgi:hypothetical protein